MISLFKVLMWGRKQEIVMNSYTNIFFIMLGFNISFIRLDGHSFFLYKKNSLYDYKEIRLCIVSYIKKNNDSKLNTFS